jgi:transcriptional regulator with XRE-family HTH domain
MDQGSNRQRFAARLGELRHALGLSYNDVGAAVGVSGETIRNYELGRSAPRKKRDVVLLEEALDARTGELWAMLTGYEIPAPKGKHRGGDDSAHLVAAIFDELQALREAIEELQSGQNGEPPESHRGSRTRVPVPSQRAS